MDTYRNKQAEEWSVITSTLVPEFVEKFTAWNDEYGSQERDLGAAAEFVNFWRKAKKIKAIVWDGVDAGGWRESFRIVLFEIIGHAFLMLFDIDKEAERAKGEVVKAVKYPQDPVASVRPDLRIPSCGHIRCVEHPHINVGYLSAEAALVFTRERREEANRVLPNEVPEHEQ